MFHALNAVLSARKASGSFLLLSIVQLFYLFLYEFFYQLAF